MNHHTRVPYSGRRDDARVNERNGISQAAASTYHERFDSRNRATFPSYNSPHSSTRLPPETTNSAPSNISNDKRRFWQFWSQDVPPSVDEVNQALEQLSITEKDVTLCRSNRDKLKDQVKELEEKIPAQKAQLDHLRQLLSSSRAFASRESTVDAKSLIQDFNDLNTSIVDFAYGIVCANFEMGEKQLLDPQRFEAMQEVLRGKSGAYEHISHLISQASTLQLKLLDVVQAVAQYLMSLFLMEDVFRPFAPGFQPSENRQISDLYFQMCQSLPQEHCGNWRAITYKLGRANSLENSDSRAEHNSFLLSKVINNLLGITMEAEIPSDQHEEILQLYKAATRLHKKIRTEYLSYDYIIRFYTPGISFNDMKMSAHQAGKHAATVVLLPLGFGLKAEKSMMGSNNVYHREHLPVVKAPVLCDNWDVNWVPNA